MPAFALTTTPREAVRERDAGRGRRETVEQPGWILGATTRDRQQAGEQQAVRSQVRHAHRARSPRSRDAPMQIASLAASALVARRLRQGAPLALVAATGADAHAPNVSIREDRAPRSTRVVSSRTAEDDFTIRSRGGRSVP